MFRGLFDLLFYAFLVVIERFFFGNSWWGSWVGRVGFCLLFVLSFVFFEVFCVVSVSGYGGGFAEFGSSGVSGRRSYV